MAIAKPLAAVALCGLLCAVDVEPAEANACIHAWAVPGTYTISGAFRGPTESASARLTRDCRVFLQVPGVFSGGPLRRDGDCVRFGFRVEGQRQAFAAKWCNTYGIVPWNGVQVRAEVRRQRRR